MAEMKTLNGYEIVDAKARELIATSKDAYYIDFSSATETSQPATAEMIEFVTKYSANKNVCAHIKDTKAAPWGVAEIRGSLYSGVIFTSSALVPAAIKDRTPTTYKSFMVQQVNGEWVYHTLASYEFALATEEYVNALFNGIAQAERGSY